MKKREPDFARCVQGGTESALQNPQRPMSHNLPGGQRQTQYTARTGHRNSHEFRYTASRRENNPHGENWWLDESISSLAGGLGKPALRCVTSRLETCSTNPRASAA